MKYSQDGAWQRLDWKKFMNCSLTERRLPRTTDWQMKHKDTYERQSANVLKLVPIPFTTVPPPPQPRSPTPTTQLPFSSLSPYVYESVTMATSPQGQRRRELPSFRQISIAGLIYDGLFRDYNTLTRGQIVCSCTRLDVRVHVYVWVYLHRTVSSILLSICSKAALQTFCKAKD